jgi:hypothetical protein
MDTVMRELSDPYLGAGSHVARQAALGSKRLLAVGIAAVAVGYLMQVTLPQAPSTPTAGEDAAGLAASPLSSQPGRGTDAAGASLPPSLPAPGDRAASLSAIIPRPNEDLIAVVGAHPTLQLLSWTGGASSPDTKQLPKGTDPYGLSLDAGGSLLAFLGPADHGQGRTLYVGTLDAFAPAVSGVTSFVWHATQPERLAWTTTGTGGTPPALYEGGISIGSGEVSSRKTGAVGPAERLVAWGSWGFVLTQAGDGREIVWTRDADGRLSADFQFSFAAAADNGSLLLYRVIDDGTSAQFFWAHQSLGRATRLSWAPEKTGGEKEVAAWSPGGRELAFVAFGETGVRRQQLQVWALDGTLLHSLALQATVFGVEWSADGRFILMPGNHLGHLLLVFDTETDSLDALRFDQWVQFAAMP